MFIFIIFKPLSPQTAKRSHLPLAVIPLPPLPLGISQEESNRRNGWGQGIEAHLCYVYLPVHGKREDFMIQRKLRFVGMYICTHPAPDGLLEISVFSFLETTHLLGNFGLPLLCSFPRLHPYWLFKLCQQEFFQWAYKQGPGWYSSSLHLWMKENILFGKGAGGVYAHQGLSCYLIISWQFVTDRWMPNYEC